jgi:hypothetical protein
MEQKRVSFECQRSPFAFAKDTLHWSSQVHTALLDMHWHSCGIQHNTFTFRLCSVNVRLLTFVISAGSHVFPSASIPHSHSAFHPVLSLPSIDAPALLMHHDHDLS